MSNSKYSEGTESSLSDIIGRLSLTAEKCISTIIEKESFINYNVIVKDIATNGGNYLATLQEIDIKGETTNGNKEINLFVKNRVITDEFNIFPVDKIYNNEAFYYNELLKIYEKLQDDANIPDEDRYRIVESFDVSNTDVTILDNLSKKGYKTWDRLDVISFEFAEMSIKQLAKFHALSFAVKANMPKFFENRIKPIRSLYNLESEWKSLVENTLIKGLSYLESEARRKMEIFFPIMKESYRKFVNISNDNATCLCHGDFRPNNIMINEKNGKIDDLIAIDFQLIHCGRPASDFIYFIFTGTDQKFRRAYLNNLKELYYNAFEYFLKYFGIFAEDVYTKYNFESDFRDHLNYGLTTYVMLLPFIFCKNDEIPDIKKDVSKMSFQWNDTAQQRWRELVEDFIVWQNL